MQVIWKVLGLLRSFAVILQHSALYNSTDRTLLLHEILKPFVMNWYAIQGGVVTLVVTGYGIEIGLSSDRVRLHLFFTLTHFILSAKLSKPLE